MPYRYPGTLAAFFTRDAYIFRQQTKAAAGIFPCFAALSLIYSAYDILRQAEVCLNAQSCHGIFYKFCINDLHFLLHQFSLPHNYKQKQSGSQPNSRLVFCIFRAHSARECSVPEGSRPSDARYLFRRLSRRPSALVRQSLRNRFLLCVMRDLPRAGKQIPRCGLLDITAQSSSALPHGSYLNERSGNALPINEILISYSRTI